jgi:hypothetical protein
MQGQGHDAGRESPAEELPKKNAASTAAEMKQA